MAPQPRSGQHGRPRGCVVTGMPGGFEWVVLLFLGLLVPVTLFALGVLVGWMVGRNQGLAEARRQG